MQRASLPPPSPLMLGMGRARGLSAGPLVILLSVILNVFAHGDGMTNATAVAGADATVVNVAVAGARERRQDELEGYSLVQDSACSGRDEICQYDQPPCNSTENNRQKCADLCSIDSTCVSFEHEPSSGKCQLSTTCTKNSAKPFRGWELWGNDRDILSNPIEETYEWKVCIRSPSRCTRLFLASRGLTGSIPASIGTFVNLQLLYVSALF